MTALPGRRSLSLAMDEESHALLVVCSLRSRSPPQPLHGDSPNPTRPRTSKEGSTVCLTSELSRAQLRSWCLLGPWPSCSSHLDIGVWGTQVRVGQSW